MVAFAPEDPTNSITGYLEYWQWNTRARSPFASSPQKSTLTFLHGPPVAPSFSGVLNVRLVCWIGRRCMWIQTCHTDNPFLGTTRAPSAAVSSVLVLGAPRAQSRPSSACRMDVACVGLLNTLSRGLWSVTILYPIQEQVELFATKITG